MLAYIQENGYDPLLSVYLKEIYHIKDETHGTTCQNCVGILDRDLVECLNAGFIQINVAHAAFQYECEALDTSVSND